MELWVNLQGLCYMGDVDEGKQADKDEDDEKDAETEDKTAKEKKFVIVNFPT